MKKLLFIGTAIMLATVVANAQKIKIKSGSLDPIKNEKVINIKYDYSDMRVGKFDKEEDYVNKKVTEYNEKEKGKGDLWKKKWIRDREERFEPKFEQLINKYLDKTGISVEESEDAKYTFILKTTFTEPGFNVYVHRKPALIDVELTIVETANPDNVIAVIESKKNTGTSMGMDDYDTGARIREAYAKCGKELGKYISKKLK